MTQQLPYVVGIDGGGTSIRVAVASADLNIIGYAEGGSANPVGVGREAATKLIQEKTLEALRNAKLDISDIDAIAAGIAGASSEYATDWLEQTLRAVVPHALVVPSSDIEVALVGAHGKREGVLVLSGTGSIALGINAAGEMVRVGGWGYLLGDEGSGHLIGMQGLRAVTLADDQRIPPTSLTEALLAAVGVENVMYLIPWVYDRSVNRIPDVAALAPIVLEHARHDAAARAIVDEAIDGLVEHAETIIRRLEMPEPAIAFTGGLLTRPNALSEGLAQRLGLPTLPVPRYSPVIGAALLALEHLRESI
jgi:glucosamine kinase